MSSDTPTMPTQPTASQNMQDWISNYPAMFALQKEYAPQEAQQQVDLANQYAGQLGTAMKSAQEAMYPNETALSNTLTQQAQEGMTSQVPAWMKQQYQSNMNAQLGSNVNAPIGADYVSTGLLQQQQDWQKYYQNLGLTITGRQPVAQATTPTYSNYASSYTPSSVSSSNNSNYSTAMSGYNASQNSSNPLLSMLGSIGGGLGGGIAGGWSSNYFSK